MVRPLESGMRETIAKPAPPSSDGALDAIEVAQAMAPAARRVFDLRVVAATGSTNADLMANASRLPSGHVLAAETQTAGRGRRGREWHSQAGSSLTFSLLWKFRCGSDGLSGLSLAVGLAVVRALDRCAADAVMIKWPNDLVAQCGAEWAKLGGILIETAAATNGPATAVIGIGLNVDAGAAPAAMAQAATSLAALGRTASRNLLLARMLEELATVLTGFEAGGFAPFAAHWNARHAYRGQAVTLSGDSVTTIAGIAREADAQGALLVETPGGLKRVISGEVSLRPAAPV